MALITIPNTFSAGAVIIASQHNSNFTTISSDYNGNIDNTNIATSAAIAYSKLNLATSIVNADVSASAAIVDTKLAQITTASKVSGTSITGLASLPGGAGVVPIANIGTGATSTNFLRGDGTFASQALSLVSNTTVTATTTTGNISITSGNTYMVIFNLAAFGSGTQLLLRFNADSGANYNYVNTGSTTTGAITNNATGGSSINIGKATKNGASIGINGRFMIMQVGTSSQVYRIWGDVAYDDNTSGLFALMNFAGSWTNAANATSFSLLTSGVNMTGTVQLYQMITS